ncbi:ankyrin repeat domain-containing protein [Halopseudomonas salegens]|uniref:Ankyrin repeat-containing protein n=1 Tax=Halopseudomonas salegens TaxID=1434072 RepID=A0A1H2E0J7_9GAMM|nr:ankyrin repeat domain-containing protein [Halopseudomonas salegens]SDT88662.1 Ankyrin repeat-containing protein [Halopseudomonas salegens]
MKASLLHKMPFLLSRRNWLILGVTLLLTACFPGNGQGNRFMNHSYPASTFFKGHYLLLAQAIERNDMAQLRQLAEGQDLSLKGEKDMDLMWFAIAHENFDAIQALVELGVNPDAQIAQGIGSALQFTFMKHDDTRYLKAMLDGGLSPNHQYPGQKLMLQRGVFGGLEHVKLLLEHGTRIDDRDSIGRTALHEASTRMKPDIAIYLVQQGAEFNTYTAVGSSIAWGVYLDINDTRPGNPIHTQFLELRDLMIEKGAKWPPDSPIEVRDQMRARGENPPVPPGQPR